jgi:membrane-associated protease RseP (regulator of RpoE activity)
LPEWIDYILYFFLIWIIIYLGYERFGKKNKNIIVQPFQLMIRTSRLNNWIKKLAGYNKNLSRKIFNLGVVVGAGLIIFILYLLLRNLGLLFERPEQAMAIVPLVPGLTISLKTFPYILVALFIALITHELAHGIAGSIDGIPIKSSGVLIFAVIGGAFVEYDEKRLNKAKLMTKLRVFAAGTYANIIAFAFVTLLLMGFTLAITPFYDTNSSGVLISELVVDGPAEQAGLTEWDIIYALNGTSIEGLDGLTDYMTDIRPNTLLIANTSSGFFEIKTQPHPTNSSRAAIGIRVQQFDNYEPKFDWLPRSLPYHLLMTGSWTSMILLSLAAINMMPLYPFDGDKFLNSLFEKFLPKYSKPIRISFNVICFIILFSNIIIYILLFGLVRF